MCMHALTHPPLSAPSKWFSISVSSISFWFFFYSSSSYLKPVNTPWESSSAPGTAWYFTPTRLQAGRKSFFSFLLLEDCVVCGGRWISDSLRIAFSSRPDPVTGSRTFCSTIKSLWRFLGAVVCWWRLVCLWLAVVRSVWTCENFIQFCRDECNQQQQAAVCGQ